MTAPASPGATRADRVCRVNGPRLAGRLRLKEGSPLLPRPAEVRRGLFAVPGINAFGADF